MDLGLKGKIALLTGASRGLGFATAKILAQEGVRIAINARDQATLAAAGDRLAQFGSDVISLPGDLTDPENLNTLLWRHWRFTAGLTCCLPMPAVHLPQHLKRLTIPAGQTPLTSPS
jgi:NAD(P)-dependent dehydrogenase (short-subunit alcohol dehydrogenase family)